jgi:hypothetical protein
MRTRFRFLLAMILLGGLASCVQERSLYKRFEIQNHITRQEIILYEDRTALLVTESEGEVHEIESGFAESEGEIVVSGENHELRFFVLKWKGDEILIPEDMFRGLDPEIEEDVSGYVERSPYYRKIE